MTDRVQVPEEYTTENMAPDEHIVMASAFLHEAQRPIIKRAKHNGADEMLPFVGEDVHVQRHVDTYSRLATLHMQMASTKTLLASTQPAPAVEEIRNLLSEVYGRPPATDPRVWPKGTVTGRMQNSGPPPFEEVELGTKRSCERYIRRDGELRLCGNLLYTDGSCPAASWHAPMGPNR